MDPTSTTSQAIGSDALKKAIERNRKKQQDRNSHEINNSWRPPRPSIIQKTYQKTEVEKKADNKIENDDSYDRPRATRKTVAQQNEEVSFVTELKNKRNKFTEILSYGGERELRAKKNLAGKWNNLLVKAAWIFIGILLLRLIFVNRGVMDYYTRDQIYMTKVVDYKNLLKENAAIRKEIFKIKNDIPLQKKLVRDHLGFISADEFLVLFQGEEKAPSK